MTTEISTVFLEDLKASPRNFKETVNPVARIKMKAFAAILAEFHYWLRQETGWWQALKILLKSWTWDMVFNRPTWQPELFPIQNAEDEKIWQSTFKKDVVFVLTLFNNLKRTYGLERGDEIMAKFMMPVTLQYHFHCFKPITNLTHIDQIRQQMADYLGDGKTMRNRIWLSDDGQEARYYYTRCMHMQIMLGYGMKRSAQACCLADHVTFDKRIPTVRFKRTKTLTLGDGYCDHRFIVREPGETNTPEDHYEDANRADYDARTEIKILEHRFDQYGPKLRA